MVLDGAEFFDCLLLGLIHMFRRKEGLNVIAAIFLLPILTTRLIGLIFVSTWRYRLIVCLGLHNVSISGLLSCIIHRGRSTKLTIKTS